MSVDKYVFFVLLESCKNVNWQISLSPGLETELIRFSDTAVPGSLFSFYTCASKLLLRRGFNTWKVISSSVKYDLVRGVSVRVHG